MDNITNELNKLNIYEVKKKDNYSMDDCRAVVGQFNISLEDFLKEICKICNEKKWTKEANEIGSYIQLIKTGIKVNTTIGVDTFLKYVYPHWNYIKVRDEHTLLEFKYESIIDKKNIGIIFKYKKLWDDTGEENKEYMFQALDYLCHLTEHYEDISYKLGHKKIRVKLLEKN